MAQKTEARERGREIPPIVEDVCRALDERIDPDELELVRRFTRLLLGKAPVEFLEERGVEALAGVAAGAFDFLQDARPDRVDVQAVNPGTDEEGWHAPVTVIRTNVSERPFIVDTLREYLHAQDLPIENFVYPILRVIRDEEGRISDIGPASGGGPEESLIHCEVSRITDRDVLEEVRTSVEEHLQDVVRATDDFNAMVDALNDTVAYLAEASERLPRRKDEVGEVQEFLRWLRDGGFVFLGYRSYDLVDLPDRGRAIVVEPGSGLGILRKESESRFSEPAPLDDVDPDLRERIESGPLLIISKTNALSTVHRRARMDYIGVKKLDEDGEVVGEHRFIGLFTSQAYSEDAEEIPILRQKLGEILDESGVIEGSHDYKEIRTIFNSMPKEELFLTSAEEIGSDVQEVLTLYHTEEVRVSLRPDPLERGVSVMVILPRERFSGDVRRAIEDAFVEEFDGDVLNYHLALGGGDQARLHFYISSSPDRLDEVAPEELEQIVRRLIRTWEDRIREGLESRVTADEARRLARIYAEAFSPEYRAATDPEVAIGDILELEAMANAGRTISIRLSNRESAEGIAVDEPVTELKLYLREERLVLSDFMPILENCGLRVIAVSPFELVGDETPVSTLYIFAVQDSDRRPIDVEGVAGRLARTILAVRAGDAASDRLNALVLSADLHWREVDVLRAYAEYAFQLGAVPSRLSLRTALQAYPRVARLLIELFTVKFDPGLDVDVEGRVREVARIRREMVRSLEDVVSLADDRALRRLFVLIDATVRTNYFVHGGREATGRSGGVPYLSFKIACRELEGVVRSRLLFEVWVHSSRMAGIHLRGGRVARGGIRYSDRPDDFRTEVDGLVKTQMVKNAVIVPSGSKGGFVTRLTRSDPDDMAREVTDQYRTLMRGLLDITDNLVDGAVLRPEDVMAYDDPDPYLVVAADKGTAHLSDVANAVSAEYGYWLDDAFASGGSTGYDHKEVGITAKGAWECVERHFREMGKDCQSEPFTVVGIGDMSGDVFGNAMLLSRQIRLLAAFDHRHIFVDPDPDPEASFEERKRLFEAGRTSWDDYDRDALSEGGFVVPRGAKEVELSPPAREALGVPDDAGPLDGESLIRAVLKAPADLLWNGGIGTYVKASDETHAEVGDPANDAVRIDAPDVSVSVVGEGGNLGFTQEARVEFALAGGRLNTDALDNSGGVDMSDREVNLKILLNRAVAAGRLDQEERNRLLEELTTEVTELVLRDSRSQSLAVSLDEIRARRSTDDFQELMIRLERDGLLDRTAEHLPTAETLEERREEGRSLTRPELAVLLAYAKLRVKQRLVESALPDDPTTDLYLERYFPAGAVEASGPDALESHRLRREIIATQLTNDMVDLMGSAFVTRMTRDTGARPDEVARAWLIASKLSDARRLRRRLASLEGELASRVLHRWHFGLVRVLDRTTRWVLNNVPAERSTGPVIEEHREGIERLRDHFGELVAGEERRIFEARVREMGEITDDDELARRLITLRFLDQLLEILAVAREAVAEPLRVARAYYLGSDEIGVPWLRQALFEAAADDRWDQRAAQLLADDLGGAHRRFTVRILGEGGGEVPVEDLLERVRNRHQGELAELRELLDDIRSEERTSLPALSVVVREVERLAAE